MRTDNKTHTRTTRTAAQTIDIDNNRARTSQRAKTKPEHTEQHRMDLIRRKKKFRANAPYNE